MSDNRRPFLGRFFAKHDGATAVEFALLAAPLIALLLAVLQTALVFFLEETMQTAAEASGRQLMTGTAQNAGVTQSGFASVVCSNLPSLFDCSALMVDVQAASSFSSISTAPLTLTYSKTGAVTNSFQYSPGNPGDIVIVRVMYDWPIVGGPLGSLLANQSNGTRLLVGTTVFKNEPFK